MKAVLFVILAASAWAQTPVRYSATTGDVVLVTAGTKLTLQQPATNGKQVKMEAAVIYCSVACDVTMAQNGTAATATTGTVSPLLPFGPVATASVFTASDVGNGTAAGGIIHLAASERVTLDMSKVAMGNTGTRTNYTWVISSITGNANITIFWSEQ